jgi:diguanylate cyclase (GGDEF)-like protein
MKLMFLDANQDISLALQADYIWVLVLISYFSACMAAYTAWGMSEQFRLYRSQTKGYVWLVGGACSMGLGIWAMHFIAMLAYQLPIPVAYDLKETLLSVVPAIMASAVAIYLLSYEQVSKVSFALGGLIFGLGIGAMHYSGMAAMIIDAQMRYDKALFILSIGVAVLLSYLALWLKYLATRFKHSSVYRQIKSLSISLVAVAISAMHYMGMAAVYFFPNTGSSNTVQGLDPMSLSILVIIITGLIMGLSILTSLFQQRLISAYLTVEASQERLRNAINSISDGIVLFDKNDRLVMSNNVFNDMYQSSNHIILPGISYQSIISQQSQYISSEALTHRDYFDKRITWHQNPNSVFNETLVDGRQVIGKEQRTQSGDLVGTWTDISQLKEIEEKLTQSREQLTGILEVSPIPIIIRALKTQAVLYFNANAKRYFERRNTSISLGKNDTFLEISTLKQLGQELIEKGELLDQELQFTNLKGEVNTIIFSAVVASYEYQPAAIISFFDITQRKNLENELRKMAQTDSLTGVFNRRYFSDMGKREFIRCRRNRLPLCLMMLDIDHFKRINDEYGHDMGDEAIKTLCKLCKDNLRDLEILARIGGEEFAILIPDKPLTICLNVAKRIRQVIESNRLNNNGVEIRFTVSIGICELNNDYQDFEELIKSTDIALFKAKNQGRNQVQIG